MTRMLVIFGTSDGHTRTVAARLGDVFRAQGLYADVVEAGTAAVRPADYHGVVVCASVHGGRYQRAVTRWVRDHAVTLSEKPTAFVSVCLAVLQKEPKVQHELEEIVGRFLSATEWRPGSIKQVAGALLYRKYGFFKRWVMQRIVAKAGGDTDTSRNHEYTDWNDLQAFAIAFGRSVVAARDRLETAAAFQS